QPSVEEHGHDISKSRSGESGECDKRSMNDNYEKGLIYHPGESVVHDYPRAKEYFLEASIHGHAGAQNYLGDIYREGQGVLKEYSKADYSKAIEWYQKAASQRYAAAQNSLGIMYENGYGVPKDISKAIEL
ncbi:hypothetical protein BGZ79_003060, partial [Entomortierella chlamydospora]